MEKLVQAQRSHHRLVCYNGASQGAPFFYFENQDVTLRPIHLLTILLCAVFLSACSSKQTPTEPAPAPPDASPPVRWTPPWTASWQIQRSGPLDPSLPVNIYFLDLFNTPPETISQLHARGVKVVCLFSAGTLNNQQPDAGQFPPEIQGNGLTGQTGEVWLDIRNLQALAPIVLARFSLASQKGCDSVAPEHVNGYANNTGFPLNAEDQLAYNIFLANAAHQNNFAIGLTDDIQQIPNLVSFFDWALNEDCFSNQQCDQLLPFTQAGKPVFVIEYNLEPSAFCGQAASMQFNAIRKNPSLDAALTSCR